jgi:hypothetical protein
VRACLLAALALAVTAVATPASAAEQLKRHALTGERVSVGVPNSWLTYTGGQILDPQTLEQLQRDNPRFALYLEAFARSGAGVKLVAFDPRIRGQFATNLNVLSVPAPQVATFEQFRDLLLAELRGLVPGKVSSSVVRIDGQRTVRASYRLRLTAAGRTVTTQVLQYAFLHRGKSLVFTYSTLPRFAGDYARAFRASATSIRFG